MVRLMFAHMEPFAIVVGWPPKPLGIHSHQPGIVALLELRQRTFSCFFQKIQVEIYIVPLYRFPPFLTQFHGDPEFLFYSLIPTIPLHAFKSVFMVKSIGCSKMIKQGANCIRL